METAALAHLGGLVVAFLSVTIGAQGLLKQFVELGLLPLGSDPARWRGELAHRAGVEAARRGWCASQRNAAARDLIKARQLDVTPDDFVGTCLVYSVAGAAGALALTVLAGGAVWNLVPAAIAAALLFQAPQWSLKSHVTSRLTAVSRRLPYSLEVIVLAMEAGAGFEQSLAILVHQEPNEPLHEEFDQVLRDTQMGLTRREALGAMASRLDTEDLSSLVMAINISDDLGTSLGPTLRTQAEAIRNNRLQRAERMAREAGPKMAMPNTMIMVANVLLILAPFLPKLSLGGGF
jgi:tight adherence protein C